MDIHIKWDDDKKGFQFPVNPSGINVSESMNNTSLYVHNKGEINLKGKKGLRTTSWSSFFPMQDYDFCQCKPRDAYDYYCANLKKLMEKNETVHLIVTGTDIDMFCTIDSFEHGPQERVEDVTYTISFKEYVDVNLKKRHKKSTKTKEIKWKKGDTWHKLTKKVLGSSSKWKTVRKNNAKVIHKAKKKHPKAKEATALVGYKVVIKA